MIINYQGWRRLFLFCLGLFAGTAFCMKWMEGDFLFEGRLFTILGLEISYPVEEVTRILSGIETPVQQLLRYHLYFDFAFMAGVYPGIAALCMMGRFKTSSPLYRRILLGMALLQGVAWGCDIAENRWLLHWMEEPGSIHSFSLYHIVVIIKWVLALTGVLLAIPFAARRFPRN